MAKGDPIQYCGAKTRAGSPCAHEAGWGTDHVGNGRCKMHGGKSIVRHGRYSTTLNQNVRDLVERFEADPDPLNVIPELSLARALLHDWLDRYESMVEALVEWNAGEKERPARIPDLHEIMPLVDGISKVVARVEKARSQSAVSMKDFTRLMTEMGRVVDHRVDDPEVREKIGEDWLRIRL